MTATPRLRCALPAHKFAVPIYLIARHRKTFADNVKGRPNEPFWGTIAAMVEERHTRQLKSYLPIIEIAI